VGKTLRRCCWPTEDALLIAYHDEEWGVPVRDDRALFAKLLLDGFQAGLSWLTILRKRDAFYRAFDDFDPARIARFDARRRAALMRDPGIVRNRAKIAASVANARAFLRLQERGSFSAHLWGFAGGRPIVNRWRSLGQLPAESGESRAMSKDLRERGFSFVGPTICYAFMQAVGMVNDHLVDCHRYAPLAGRASGAARGRAARGSRARGFRAGQRIRQGRARPQASGGRHGLHPQPRPSWARYSSHSIGSRYFFLLLHSLQAVTRLPRVVLPPRMTGTRWSMVSSAGGKAHSQ
jgi:DNA-3-methyladenine glycosylase I